MTAQQSNPNPIFYASKWSKLCHNWISELINISHKQGTLYLNDLYDILPQHESKKLTEKLEDNWLDEIRRYPDKSSLFRATVRTMRWTPLLIGFILIPLKFVIILQPLLIIYLMDFFEPCSTMSVYSAYLIAFVNFLCFLFGIFCHHTFYYLIGIFAMKMRIAHHGLIYRKILRLSSNSLNAFGSGQITNIFSNDASQIEMALNSYNYIWVAPIDIIAMIILFWYFIKNISLIAIGYTIATVLLTSIISHFLVYFRRKILQVTDERVKIMSEIIKSIRIIKMYCWETAFNRKIRRVRKHEIIRYILSLIVDSIQIVFTHTYVCITFLIIYGTLWSRDMRFDTRFFAVASCMLSHLEISVIDIGIGMHDLVHYLTAEKRMKAFLLLDESERDHRLISTSSDEVQHEVDEDAKKMVQSPIIECHLKQAHWEQNRLFCLKNIVFDAHPGDLICIIGPVGCGKSSLLQTLTGEITFFEGQLRLRGSFCYVPQESWIFSSTIKKNILFGKEYDPQTFRRVIHVAALETDLDQLPDGINTMIGDQGVMLSGGQKARINMARALYRDADIYLLDDPLSAVDVEVSKHLFERCIKDYLRNKICILVTHQIQFLQDATKIIVLNNGEMVQMGTYRELLKSLPSFSHMLDNIHQQEPHEHPVDIQRKRSIRRMTSTETENEEDKFLTTETLETKEKGSVKWRVYVEYLRASVGVVTGLVLLVLSFGVREATSVFSSWWLAEWSEDESHRHRQFNNCTEAKDKKINVIQSMSAVEWDNHRNKRFYYYCGIALVLTILTLFRTVTLQLMCLNASRVLHNQMFRRLIHCPISFFDLNPIGMLYFLVSGVSAFIVLIQGRILNRFTKDIAIVDERLSATLFELLHCLFKVLGVIALVSWLNPLAFIPAVITAIGMLYIRYRFAPCSRDLKRIEGTTRSPFFSYLISTIHGLKVIRSYHAENICSNEFFHHLDNNTRADYLFLTTNRWAAIRFDWITLFFVTVVTLFAIVIRSIGRQFSAADIALTLSYSLNLMGLLQWTVRKSVEVEIQMTSVERVLEYCSLDQEPSPQSSSKHQPSSNWPSQGHIIFDNVSMAYSKDSPTSLALHHISLVIQPGEKIGIVGRTGAGKSSLIQTLFRMGTLVHGHIIIDDVDIGTIGLDDVRRRISIIPQDPVLFTGTMRSNLDQFGQYSDVEIWNALEQVQLKKLVSDMMSNGLQSLVSESGSNLSVGQKQLVCLARAILKKSKILVIDEATANVDNATDELIQKSIRDQFKECTVLTVAHRLRTVIDSDRIMVLSDGKLVEFDSPRMLLSNSYSRFNSLVEQTGAAEAEHLHMLAKQKIMND